MTKNKLVRIDPLFELDLKQIAKIRLNNNLAKFSPNALSMREMTMLLRRTNGYRLSMEELKLKAKRENCR